MLKTIAGPGYLCSKDGLVWLAFTGKLVYIVHHFILLQFIPFELGVDIEGQWFEHSSGVIAAGLICHIYNQLIKFSLDPIKMSYMDIFTFNRNAYNCVMFCLKNSVLVEANGFLLMISFVFFKKLLFVMFLSICFTRTYDMVSYFYCTDNDFAIKSKFAEVLSCILFVYLNSRTTIRWKLLDYLHFLLLKLF